MICPDCTQLNVLLIGITIGIVICTIIVEIKIYYDRKSR